jgi:hypothetical protein
LRLSRRSRTETPLVGDFRRDAPSAIRRVIKPYARIEGRELVVGSPWAPTIVSSGARDDVREGAGSGRLETEAATLTLAEAQLALAALASLLAGELDALEILRSLVKRARRTLLPRIR